MKNINRSARNEFKCDDSFVPKLYKVERKIYPVNKPDMKQIYYNEDDNK